MNVLTFWPLFCLSFELRYLITLLICSDFSCSDIDKAGIFNSIQQIQDLLYNITDLPVR